MAPASQRTDLRTDYQQATSGLTANERDQGPLNEIAKRLQTLGYSVSLPQTDEMGRNQGLIIDGKLYRVIDSSNNWTLGEGPSAWGSERRDSRLSPIAFPTQPTAAAPGPAIDPELTAAVRAQLLKLMSGTDRPFDAASDPRAAAYRRARGRSADQERAQAAERAAFMGLNLGGQGSGAFETQVQGIQEGAGEDIAGYEADIQNQEVQARRQQLIQALELATAVGARNEANALQRELANLDTQYRYAALGEQGRQFNERSDLDWTQLEAILNRQAMLDALGQGG